MDLEKEKEEINKFNESVELKFFSRCDIIRHLKYPASSDKRVIIMPNNEGLGFRYDLYQESALGKILPE